MPRSLKGDAGNPFHFRAGISQGVQRCHLVIAEPSRLAVVQAAGQFANDQHVGAGQHGRLQRSAIFETGPDPRRPQVRVQPQLAPNGQKPGLGATVRTARVERGISNGTEKDRVGAPRRAKRVVRQWREARTQRGAAYDTGMNLKGVAKLRCNRFENGDGRRRDLRPDAVTGKDEDRGVHTP